ncbi:hypothetical protein ACH4E7_16445 [Kitasatospora sp. NPDC018058]|uniref:hypothetical protein n=1 Tax=Kitasatospora sp. NPDC018058 TaxID=3364025 RepID=UPI0037BE70E6
MVISQRPDGERRALRAALGALALLTLLGAVGDYGGRQGGLLVLREWFDRPLLLFTVALPLLLVVLYCVTWRAWIRVVLGLGVLLTAAATVPVWIFHDYPQVVATHGTPDRSDRRIVRQEQSGMLSTAQWIFVDQGTGLTTRRWQIAYADFTYGDVIDAAWDGPDRIRLTYGSRTKVIELAADGRPSGSLTLA